MRTWIRRFGRRRRLIAAALAAVAMTSALAVVRPGEGPASTVVVAARDLSPGVLRPGDTQAARLPRSAVPDGALTSDPAGWVLAAPVRRGEPITDVRLLDDPLLARLTPGLVAAPVRIADSDAARLVRPGSTVGVLAAWENAPAAHTIAEGLTVLATPSAGDDHGALLVLAATPDQASQLAAAQAGGRLSITILRHAT
ncbi:SAF domain-containing protein [Thermoactinospora rubra]|uniref:SAF domain-containing protein n=1 Tax=Thermoactinospora rubra TaxID=1088767 RepID=UPI000A10478F|nr:SAF domain-containing protein [Thermoactinospora rubra]